KGYSEEDVYLPLYAYVGNMGLWAQLRTADHGPAHGVVEALQKMIGALRRRCKKARIIIRADNGFCTDELMAWCEGQAEVYYCVGMARNSALLERAQRALVEARARHCLSGGGSPPAVTPF